MNGKQEASGVDREQPAPAVTVFYDGECPLCAREIRFLARRDAGRGRVRFVDIAAPGFDASTYGLDRERLMAKIHGLAPDGSLIEGMEVFRRVYAAVGLGALLAPTAWPVLRPITDFLYRLFARNRLRLTGRDRCETGRCAVPDGSFNSSEN